MDRDDIDDLLDDLDAQNSDTNDSDLSNEVFSESSTVAGDNGKHNSCYGLAQIELTQARSE